MNYQINYILFFFIIIITSCKEKIEKNKNQVLPTLVTLENEEFLRVISPFLDIVSNRIEQTSHLNNSNELVETSDDDYNMFVTSYFKSPIDDQEYSVISYNTAILS